MLPSPLRSTLVAASLVVLSAACSGPSHDLQPGESLAPSRLVFADGALADGAARGERPAPTEHRLAEDAEESNSTRRKAWLRERHRAPPDVDVDAVERRNGLQQIARRNALSSYAAATGSRWTERGSENQAGRTHVAARSTDGTRLYVGTSLGGIWRGGLDGSGWEPLGDNLYGGVHFLALAPGAPGQPDAMIVASNGGLVHRSTDDGATWTVPAGLPNNVVGTRRLLVRPGTGTIFLLIRWWNGGQYVHTIYRSTDGGASFEKSLGMSAYAGDVWTPRDAAGPLYALKQDQIQRSLDDGVTWSVVGSTGVSSSGGELTGSEAGAPRLWAALSVGGTSELHRSDDAGGSFAYVLDLFDYWGRVEASATDPALFAWGGVEVHRTADSGGSFAVVNGWGEYYGNPAHKLHADVQGFSVVPDGLGGETWYVNTDGGTYESTDGLATVDNLSLSGLRISQYYSTHTSTANPGHVLAGAQDQGYQRASQPAPDALDFAQLISGDYGHLTSSDGTHGWVYSVYPGFILVQGGENNPSLYLVDFPTGENHGWMPTVTADPNHVERWFFCATQLWRYRKTTTLNPTWTKTVWSTQDFEGSPGEYLTAITFSPVDATRAYAATNHGRLFHSEDHGVTWTQSLSGGPSAHYFYGTAMVASSIDVDTVWAGGSGYGSPAVYRSTDGGVTFQPWGDGLPSTLVYCLAQSPDGQTLYCGTETSAYERGVTSAAWTDITSDDAPITLYWSAETVPSANVIRFGTYGRGIWDYAVDDPCGYDAYGVGLGGANVLAFDTTSDGSLGTTHDLVASGGQPNKNGYLILGLAATQLPIFSGHLLVDPGVMVLLPVTSDGAGQVGVSLPFPSDPAYDGAELVWQVALRDTTQPAGWALSNGLHGVYCLP